MDLRLYDHDSLIDMEREVDMEYEFDMDGPFYVLFEYLFDLEGAESTFCFDLESDPRNVTISASPRDIDLTDAPRTVELEANSCPI